MNDLFEAYVAALMKQALATSSLTVDSQGGGLFCLMDDDGSSQFRTRPDILVRRAAEVVMVIDTKWKRIGLKLEDNQRGIAQADVYQMMAYARLYQCSNVMLLYPHHAGLGAECLDVGYGICGGDERLRVASVDLGRDKGTVRSRLFELAARVPRGAIRAETHS